MVPDRSNGSYWRYVAALVGWMTLCGLQNHQNSQWQHGQNDSNGNKSVTITQPVKQAMTGNDSHYTQQQCIDKNGNEADCNTISVQAAVDQARDADWQADTGIIATFIGTLTLLAACYAGFWAMKAAQHTETSAIEAANSARTAEKALNSLEGAIIQPVGMTYRHGDASGAINFCFQNYGRSSAIVNDVSVMIFITIANNPTQIQSQTKRPFMFEERISEREKSETLIVDDDILRRFGENIDNAINDLHIMIVFSWENLLGKFTRESRRFIWSPRRKKFLSGSQLWEEIDRFGEVMTCH